MLQESLDSLPVSVPSVKTSTAIIAAGVVVAVLSLILQYLSHRHSIIDTPFERETKISQFLGDELVNVPGFTAKGYDLQVRQTKVVVNENKGLRNSLWKYLNPFSDISGTTLVTLELAAAGGIPHGVYSIKGWSDCDCLIRDGIILHKRGAVSLLCVEIESVDIREPVFELGNLANSSELELSTNDEELVESWNTFF